MRPPPQRIARDWGFMRVPSSPCVLPPSTSVEKPSGLGAVSCNYHPPQQPSCPLVDFPDKYHHQERVGKSGSYKFRVDAIVLWRQFYPSSRVCPQKFRKCTSVWRKHFPKHCIPLAPKRTFGDPSLNTGSVIHQESRQGTKGCPRAVPADSLGTDAQTLKQST